MRHQHTVWGLTKSAIHSLDWFFVNWILTLESTWSRFNLEKHVRQIASFHKSRVKHEQSFKLPLRGRRRCNPSEKKTNSYSDSEIFPKQGWRVPTDGGVFFAHSKWINPNWSWNCGSLDLPKRIPSHPSLIHSEVTGVGFLYVVSIQTYLLRLGITGEVFIRRILSNCNWKDVSMIFLFLLLLEQNQTSEQSMQCLRNWWPFSPSTNKTISKQERLCFPIQKPPVYQRILRLLLPTPFNPILASCKRMARHITGDQDSLSTPPR